MSHRPVRRHPELRNAHHQWMQDNSMRFGWFHPDWAEPTGSKPEPWHWEFAG